MEERIVNVPIIDPGRKYWLVRTNAGDFYDEFFMENYIGIGWNKIKLTDLKINRPLADIVSEKYDEERHNYVANQIIKFTKQINKGDIVLIPSRNSFYISFGEVIESDAYEDESIPDNLEDPEEVMDVDFDGRCPYKKRKKVKWLKTVRRDSMDPYLYKVIYSHHTISDATPYAAYIDRLLHSFFVKGSKAHFILEVQKKKEINAIPLINLINGTLRFPEYYHAATGDNEVSPANVDIKLNVQSPGPIELIGNIKTIFIIAASYVAIFGGNIKIVGFEFQTDGFLGKLMQFFNDRHSRDIEAKRVGLEERQVSMEEEKLRNALEELEINLPAEISNSNNEG
ncbi:hypothetical protein ABXS71_16745 [Bacillus infantis]|uniref:hypothetical protein n=1 Tax=Bacillus infantis TaxID=324767 RepID=UPI00344D869A